MRSTPVTAPVVAPAMPTPSPALIAETARLIASGLDRPSENLKPLSLAVGSASKIGPRQQNDDYAAYSTRRDLFAVADGIGGAPHGDVAAKTSANVAVVEFECGLNIEEALLAANDAVMELSWWIKSRETGSTLLLAARDDDDCPNRLDFAWAGDTVAFLLRDNSFSLITTPHRVEGSNALTAAVGYDRAMPFDTASCELQDGDRILMCTDGVWEQLEAPRLAELLATTDNAPWIAESITREAAEFGTDNATAIVLIARSEACEAAPATDETAAFAPNAPCMPVPRTPTYPQSEHHDNRGPQGD